MVKALLAEPGAHCFSLLYQTTKPLPPALQAAARPPHRLLPIAAALRSPRDQMETPLRLRQARADLYHATYYASALKAGIPTVLTVYDLIPERYPRYWSFLESLVIRHWLRAAAHRAGHILVPSVATGVDLGALYEMDAARLTVAPLAVDDWLLAPECERPDGVGERPFLLCVCTNKPHKNLPRLVRAYRQFASRSSSPPDLVLAGGWDPRYPEAMDTAADLFPSTQGAEPTVQFIHAPSDSQLRWLYRHAAAFVFPSQYEGFGLPVLEAMRAGLPVAASDTAAIAEVVGGAALLFDPQSVSAIAEAVACLVSDREGADRLAAAGKERAAHFTWRATAARTVEAYEAVLC
jgi:alpha-1,3-rhamnosyl/mannosyltransferase